MSALSSIREQFAKWRTGLRAFFFLVGGTAAAGALLALSLAVLPAGVQERLLGVLPWVPGLHETLSITPDRPEGRRSLRLDAGGREVAVFGEGMGTTEVEVLPIALVVAVWGGLLGLAAFLLWRFSGSRQVLGLAALLGIVTGLALAATLPAFPSKWSPFWLRGLGGLPGLEESVGSVVPVEGADAGRAELSSTGGLLAAYPASPAPWDSKAEVEVRPRARAWLSTYAALAWLAVLCWGSGIRVKKERLRWPLFALGLALIAWLALPFLPSAVGESWMRLVAGGEAVDSVSFGDWLPVLERTRLGHDVGAGLFAVLLAGASVVLLPIGMAVALAHAIVSRVGTLKARSQERREQRQHEKNREPIPVEGLGEEPGWLTDYEERRSGDSPAEEPHPSPADD